MFTQKKAFLAGFTLSTVGFVTYLLSNKTNRRRIENRIRNFFDHVPDQDKDHYNQDLQAKIGNPHPRDEGDNNMVSEGSMYSVKYYNERKD
jgi:hypothetical protein